jgi:hypothetical protein
LRWRVNDGKDSNCSIVLICDLSLWRVHIFILYQEYISGKATLACIHCLHFQHDALCRPEHFFLHPVLDISQSTDSTRNSVSYASSYSHTHLQSSRICTWVYQNMWTRVKSGQHGDRVKEKRSLKKNIMSWNNVCIH